MAQNAELLKKINQMRENIRTGQGGYVFRKEPETPVIGQFNGGRGGARQTARAQEDSQFHFRDDGKGRQWSSGDTRSFAERLAEIKAKAAAQEERATMAERGPVEEGLRAGASPAPTTGQEQIGRPGMAAGTLAAMTEKLTGGGVRSSGTLQAENILEARDAGGDPEAAKLLQVGKDQEPQTPWEKLGMSPRAYLAEGQAKSFQEAQTAKHYFAQAKSAEEKGKPARAMEKAAKSALLKRDKSALEGITWKAQAETYEREMADLEQEIQSISGKIAEIEAESDRYAETGTMPEDGRELLPLWEAEIERLKTAQSRVDLAYDGAIMAWDMAQIAAMPEEVQKSFLTYCEEMGKATTEYEDVGDFSVTRESKSFTEAEKQLKEYLGSHFKPYMESFVRAYGISRTEGTVERARGTAAGLRDVVSIGTQMAGSVTGSADYFWQTIDKWLKINKTGRYRGYDVNTAGQQLSAWTSAARQKTTEQIDAATKKSPGWNYLAKAGYSATMSAADSLARIWVAGPEASLALAGLGSFQEGIRDATERGGSQAQALGFGLISGGLEILTEKVSLDNLIDTPKPENLRQALKSVVIQGGIEVSEEEASFVGGILADAAIMRKNSEFNLTVERLMKEQGLSREEARDQADMGLIRQATDTAVESFLSGSMMSGGEMAFQGLERVSQEVRLGKELRKDQELNLEGLVEAGLQADKNSAAYREARKAAEAARKGKKISDRALGQLFAAVMEEETKAAASNTAEGPNSAEEEGLRAGAVGERLALARAPTTEQETQTTIAEQEERATIAEQEARATARVAPTEMQENAAGEGKPRPYGGTGRTAVQEDGAGGPEPIESGGRPGRLTAAGGGLDLGIFKETGTDANWTGGAKYSIAYDQDNTPYVNVDRDILKNIPKESWANAVKSNLREKFPNGVTLGQNTVKINNQSRREMTFSKYMQSLMAQETGTYADKLRATDNADEILKATKNWVNEALLHPRKDSIQEFARGEVQIRVGANDYTAQVIVGNRGNGDLVLYDIIGLKRTSIADGKKGAGTDYITQPQNGTGNRQSVPANTSISDFGGKINQNNAEEVRKNETAQDDPAAGSQRAGGERAAGQGGAVAEGAARAERRQTQARLANRRRAEAADLSKVDLKQLGVEHGKEDAFVSVVPKERYDQELQRIDQRFAGLGIKAQFVVGRMQVRLPGGEVRNVGGVFLGDRVLVRADDSRNTASALAEHEMFHALCQADPELKGRTLEQVRETFTEGQFDRVSQRYADGYIGTGMTAEEIEEELCADAYAGMGDFAPGSAAQQAAAREADPVYSETIRAQENRGPPTGQKNTARQGGEQKFSIMRIEGERGDYGEGVFLDTNLFDKVSPRNWGKVLGSYVYDHLAGAEMVMYDQSGKEETVRLAKAADRVRKDGANNSHKVLDKLARYKGDNIKALATVHLSELLKTSGNEQRNKEHTHQWLDESGWIHRTTYIMDRSGAIYEATLNIADGKLGKVLYEINKIRRVDDGAVPSTDNGRGSLISINSPSGNVSQEAGNVNGKYSMDKSEWGDYWGDYPVDEFQTERQAARAGYPRLDGVQVFPMKTWVRAMDRGNYGLVVGNGRLSNGEMGLQVRFFNKSEGTEFTKLMPSSLLEAVDPQYQPSDAELKSLLESMPPEKETRTDYSWGEENDVDAAPVDYDPAEGQAYMERLPENVQSYVRRAGNKMVYRMAEAMNMTQIQDLGFLKESCGELAAEYMTTGTISTATAQDIFERAWADSQIQAEDLAEKYDGLLEEAKRTILFLPKWTAQTAGVNQMDTKRILEKYMRVRIEGEAALGSKTVGEVYKQMQKAAPGLMGDTVERPGDQINQIIQALHSVELAQRALEERDTELADTYERWARNDFMAAVAEHMGDLRQARAYTQERAARKTEREAQKQKVWTAAEAEELLKNRRDAQRKLKRLEKKHLLTIRDQQMVDRLAQGILSEDMLPEDCNRGAILEIAQAQREYTAFAKQAQRMNGQRKGQLMAEAETFLENTAFKEKKAGVLYERETAERNIEDVFKDPDQAKKINDRYFTPVHRAEAEATKLKNKLRDQARALGPSQKANKKAGENISEAAAVQIIGEAQDNIEVLKRNPRMKQKDGKTIEEWRGVVAECYKQNPNLDQNKVQNAIASFRAMYDQLFTAMNEARVRNGYDPIPYRQGYFPHFRANEAETLAQKIGKAMGVTTEVTELPTAINGKTATFRPGIQYFGNANERLGVETSYDAIAGFDKYLEGAAAVIYQTDNIQALRAFSQQIRYRSTDPGIKAQIDQIKENSNLSQEQRDILIEEKLSKGKYEMSGLVAWLDEYTNILAGKKSLADRRMEALLGRNAYNWAKAMESRVAANMVAVNPGSWLTNFIPITQAWGCVDSKYLAQAAKEAGANFKSDDGFVESSTFLTNRRGSDLLVKTRAQEISEILGKPMDWIDTFTAEVVVRGRYKQNVDRGMSPEAAIGEADRFAADIMADRSKGATPTMFNQRNPVTKLFTQFQLEVNNQWSNIFKDVPRMAKAEGKTKAAMVGAVAKVLLRMSLGAWFYDELYEFIIGRRPAMDPINIVNDTVGGLTGYELPNIFDAATGRDRNLRSEKGKPGIAAGANQLISGVLEDTPFVGGLLGGGRLPIGSALPNFSNLGSATADLLQGIAGESTRSAAKNWNTIGKELVKPAAYFILPFGGGQVKKWVEGALAYAQGGSYSMDAGGNKTLQYAVNRNVGTILQLGLFGKSATPGARYWVETGFRGLNAKETAAYNVLLELGLQPGSAYDAVAEIKNTKAEGEDSAAKRKLAALEGMMLDNTGKYTIYHTILATDTEREKMGRLLELEADPGEVFEMMAGIKAAGWDLSGKEATAAKRDAIRASSLTQEQKLEAYRLWISDSKEEKIQMALDAGLTFDEYLEVENAYGEIKDEEGVEPTEKSMRFIEYLNGQQFTAEQKDVAREVFSMVRGSAGAYDAMREQGIDEETSYQIAVGLSELQPPEGKNQVQAQQKYDYIASTNLTEKEKAQALKAIMSDSEINKMEAAQEYGVTPTEFVRYKAALKEFDANGNGSITQAEAEAAIRSMKGLSDRERAVLWQLQGNWSPEKNPFDVEVGREVKESR